MKVTETEMMRPTLASFMSDVIGHMHFPLNTTICIKVGGALGLWLGLGVLQVLQEIIARVLPLVQIVKVKD